MLELVQSLTAAMTRNRKGCLTLLSLLVFVTSTHVQSETISCTSQTFQQPYQTCVVKGGTIDTKIKRVSQEDSSVTCNEGSDFGYVYYNPGEAFIAIVSMGCGGTFNVIDAASWSSWSVWSSCSVSCGDGTKSRRRTCSTGSNRDCVAPGSSMYQESTACTAGKCPPVPAMPSQVCGVSASSLGFRIMNGQTADTCQFPWVVMIYLRTQRGGQPLCGGSILDSRHILTAAHCFRSTAVAAGDILVLSGSSKMPTGSFNSYIPGMHARRVSNIKQHEDYNDDYIDNDIAILTLEDPIQFDECHIPICLADSDAPPNTSGCKTMGWGFKSNSWTARRSSELMFTDLDIASDAKCFEAYGIFYNPQTKMCAGGNGHGSCEGDSGGPLLCEGVGGRHYQYGIVSAGIVRQCGKMPGFYTRLTSYTDWIAKNTQ